MAEKLTRKEKIALQKKSAGFSPKEIRKKEKSKQSLRFVLGLLVALIGFLLYSNTLNHGYVLDDNGLIPENTSTKKGISAIPEIFKTSYRYGMNTSDFQLYRPLSKAMFAVEWGFAPDTPALSHWVNVLLYALLCYMLFRTLSRYLNGDLLIPFLTALLFAAHPIHTEVVANIKSRDEIVCLLLCLTAAFSLHSYVTKDSTRAFLIAILCFFAALFTKESAIPFVAVIPLMYYFFTVAEKKKYITTIVSMVACTIVFLLIRRAVLGHTETTTPMEDNSLIAIKDFLTQKANAIYIIGVYLKLLVFPSPLIADGSYNHFPVIGLGSWKFLVPFIILLGALIIAFMQFKKKDIVSFCILYFFATASLISNVFILIGTNYGERLMFIPSLGVCMLFAVLLSRVLKSETSSQALTDFNSFFSRYKKPVLTVFVIVILFGVKTMARNAEWKEDDILYATDVKKAGDSAHLLFYVANNITSDDHLASLPDSAARMIARNEGIDYLTRALTILPKYADAYQRRGFIYNQIKDIKKAEADYREGLIHNPTHPILYNNFGTLCFESQRYDEAKFYFQQAIKYNPQYAHALNNLASVFGVFGMGEAGQIQADPANASVHTKMSQENFSNAIEFFKRSIQADREFAEPYRLLAITYRNTGQIPEAEQYERLYKEVMQKANAKN